MVCLICSYIQLEDWGDNARVLSSHFSCPDYSRKFVFTHYWNVLLTILLLMLSACSTEAEIDAEQTPLPIRAAWAEQYDFITTQVERIDSDAVIRRFFAEPDQPFQLEPVRLAAQFERPSGGWIEISFIETRPYETAYVSKVPADVEPSMFPLSRLPLLEEDVFQQRREIWNNLRVSPTEAIQRTAPLARDILLQPFRIDTIELVFDTRVQTRFKKPAAWLIVYSTGEVKAVYWVDPVTGDELASMSGTDVELQPEEYLPYPDG